jgi:hypothetical protein
MKRNIDIINVNIDDINNVIRRIINKIFEFNVMIINDINVINIENDIATISNIPRGPK